MNEKPTIRTRVTDAANELDQLFRQRHKHEEVEHCLMRLISDSIALNDDADRYRWLITNGRWRASWWQQFGTHEELSKAIDHCMIFGEPRSGNVLAVGEPCVGGWTGKYHHWDCRCGANRPEDCKTETALP